MAFSGVSIADADDMMKQMIVCAFVKKQNFAVEKRFVGENKKKSLSKIAQKHLDASWAVEKKVLIDSAVCEPVETCTVVTASLERAEVVAVN